MWYKKVLDHETTLVLTSRKKIGVNDATLGSSCTDWRRPSDALFFMLFAIGGSALCCVVVSARRCPLIGIIVTCGRNTQDEDGF